MAWGRCSRPSSAKKSVEIAIFRFDRRDVEMALKMAASAKRVRGDRRHRVCQSRRRTEPAQAGAALPRPGIIVAQRHDLVRYHGKYILIDRRVLYVLSFNFTRLDIDHSRGFGIVTTNANWVREAPGCSKPIARGRRTCRQ
jgi:hypothetical protein